MKQFAAILVSLFLFPLFSYSQVPSPTIKQEGHGWGAVIPKNWNIIVADSTDFDNDMRDDFVFVLQADNDYLSSLHSDIKLNAAPRILLILMGAGDSFDSVTFGTKSDSVILRADGGDGDPLNPNTLIKTDGNILEINYSGGTSIQWTDQYKFSYNRQTKEWPLTYYRGTEYNTSDDEAPIKVTEVDFTKKFMKQGKVKTPLPTLPKVFIEKFKPHTLTVAPGVIL